jgi:hypothetical protein
MAKQTFTTGQVLTAAQMTSLQETAMGGGPATAKTASYVLVATDAGTTVAMNAAGATTITVNTGLFAAGDTVFIQNLGAGACTVTAGTATVATAGSLILPQNDAGILYFTATGAAIFYDYIQAGAVSPLTTKGDLYTFGTSDTRLGVGANGTTLVADSSTATGLAYIPLNNAGKNVIINGNMDIWQRGTSVTSFTASKYAADRWTSSITGTSVNCTGSQETSIPNTNSEYSLKLIQVSTTATSVTEYCARQFIEQSNLMPLLGKACTLSFWYRSNKTGTHGVRIVGLDNTGGTDQVTSLTVNTADTWEYKTFAVTAFSGVSAPSAGFNATGGLIDIGFRVGGTGAGFTSISASDYFELTQVQLELGSVATTFSRAGGTIQGELAACQRYYQRFDAGGTTTAFGQGLASSTTAAYFKIPLLVQMRVTPTTLDALSLRATDYNTGFSPSGSFTIYSSGSAPAAVIVGATTFTGLTQYRTYFIESAGTTNSYLGLGAEL